MKFLFSIIIALFLTIPAFAEIYTTADGYKFEVNLVPEKNKIMLGEPIRLRFEVKNLSEVDLGFVDGGDYRNALGRPESFFLEAVGKDGKVVPKPEIKMTFGGLAGVHKISVGGKFDKILLLPHWATFERIGDYTIFCKKGLAIGKYGEEKTRSSVQVNVSAKIQVIPANDEKMGEVIDSLGKLMLNGDINAQNLLSFVNDKRAIKYFAEAVKNNIFAIYALAKFDEDDALNAILIRKNDSDFANRRQVSYTLSQSVHPKAAEHILAMRNDRSPYVRLDVVHFLGKTKTAEATKLLQEMATDEDESVKTQAQKYLEERGEILK